MYVNYPRLRPSSLIRASAHVIASFSSFALLPVTLSVLLQRIHEHALQLSIVLTLLIIALTYLLLSWVWLIARVLQDLLRGPRGGHPVSGEW
jgi:hypothetical protein